MSEILFRVSRVLMAAFLVSCMLEAGLCLTFRGILAPLRSGRIVAAALVANFLVVPLIALGIARAFGLDAPFAAGLLLLGLTPGAPFLPKVVRWANGDLAFSVGLTMILMAGSVISLPLLLPHFLPSADISVWHIARPLLLLMVLPLIAGLLFNAGFDPLARFLCARINWVTNGLLMLIVMLILALNMRAIVDLFGTGAVAAGVLMTALAGLTGYWLGGRTSATRKVMVLGTGFRNVAAALVVGGQELADPRVTVMIVIVALLSLLMLIPITRALQESVRCEDLSSRRESRSLLDIMTRECPSSMHEDRYRRLRDGGLGIGLRSGYERCRP